jgi:hypothetical protein
MWKHLLEGFAGPVAGELSDFRRRILDWRRLLSDAGLLLGLLACTSWLARH